MTSCEVIHPARSIICDDPGGRERARRAEPDQCDEQTLHDVVLDCAAEFGQDRIVGPTLPTRANKPIRRADDDLGFRRAEEIAGDWEAVPYEVKVDGAMRPACFIAVAVDRPASS